MSLWQNLRTRLYPPGEGADAEERRNAWLFGLEAPFSQLPFAVSGFYALFAIQMGASNAIVGWLTSGPALVNLLWIIPAGALVQASKNYTHPFAIGALLQRLLMMTLALIPFLPAASRPWALVGIVMIVAVPWAVRNLAFQATAGEMFSPRTFNRYVGLRWAIMSVTDVLTMPILGRLMDIVRFPLNFQLLFGGVGLLTLLSTGLILRLRVPPHPKPARRANADGSAAPAPSFWRAYRSFIFFEIGVAVSYLALNASAPLARIYWVRDLQANGAWVGALTAATSVGMMLGTLAWSRLNIGHGLRVAVLALSAIYFGLNALLTAALNQLAALVVLGVLVGLAAGCAELAIFNRMFRVSPRARRPLFLSLHNVVANGAAFIGPLISTSLADRWGARPALAAIGAVGVAGAALIYALGWGKSPDDSESAEAAAT